MSAIAGRYAEWIIWGCFFYKISNGKQRYFIKKNSNVAEKVYTYKSVVFDLEL